MNLPSNYLAAIGHGKNIDISAVDGVLSVPPLLLPAFEVPRPVVIEGSGTNGLVYNDSTQWTFYEIRANQAGADRQAFFLLAGLWHVQFNISIRWKDLTTQSSLIKLAIVDQSGARADSFSFYWDTVNADGSYNGEFFRTWHIKARPDLSVVQGDVWSFFVQYAATNVVATQEIECQLNVNARKLL